MINPTRSGKRIAYFALAGPRSAPELVSALQDFRSGKPDAVGADLRSATRSTTDRRGWSRKGRRSDAGSTARGRMGTGGAGQSDAVRELVPLITTWPGSGGNARAVAGLDVLARIGTDLALSRLHGISRRTRSKALKARAQEKIGAVSVERGLSTEQLADRPVPDLGLDGQDELTLDYGPRRFVIGVDEQLKPRIIGEGGKRLEALPTPGGADDHELATASYKRFTGFKKDLRAVAADQVSRLERAMVDRRCWTPDEFRTLLAGHPVVGRLVRATAVARRRRPVPGERGWPARGHRRRRTGSARRRDGPPGASRVAGRAGRTMAGRLRGSPDQATVPATGSPGVHGRLGRGRAVRR